MNTEKIIDLNNKISEKTPRQMWVELSKLFHTDLEGGENKLIVKLNLAYDKFKKDRDDSKLLALYSEWWEKGGLKEGTGKVKEELILFSGELSNNIKSGKREKVLGESDMRAKYTQLCKAAGMAEDPVFLNEFLYDRSWMSEEEYKTLQV